MIDVRLFATLPMRSSTKRKEFTLEPQPGLTVADVIESEGLKESDIHIIMINGSHGRLESRLEDGDRLGLFPPVGGG
ncbi:MAG: MoaD/ThiS family protein [Gemmatimonadetes bacterium]|nr:MoaD/ThiS family protein [Thermoleophilia bacterium]NJD18487.1 MoaD/ThiS family protein [Gemmatimonadota bacterium]